MSAIESILTLQEVTEFNKHGEPGKDPGWFCEGCGGNPCECKDDGDEPEWDPGQTCDCPGHEWAYTGTQYGGDDESYFGEGRAYCIHCGADGDA